MTIHVIASIFSIFEKEEVMKPLKQVVFGSGVILCTAMASATDLSIRLASTQPVSRRNVQYVCNPQGVRMGLPAGQFTIQYLNGAGNSLAIIPVNGTSLIFANVSSGSGARYAAGQYIWWEEAGRRITFSSSSLSGNTESVCHRIPSQ